VQPSQTPPDPKQLAKFKELVGQYRRTFKTKDGEAVLKDLEARCFTKQTTLTPGQPDVTGFKEGRRSIFVRIKNMLDVNPEALKELPREYES